MVEYVTIAELMRRWRCSRETIRRRRQATRPLIDVETKQGKKRGRGRHPVLFWLKDVEEWEEEHQIETVVVLVQKQGDHLTGQPPE